MIEGFGFCINPAIWKDETDKWDAAAPLLEISSVVRGGYGIAPNESPPLKAVEQLCKKAAGKKLIYEHSFLKEDNSADLKAVRRCLAINHGDFQDTGPNEPKPLSIGGDLSAFIAKTDAYKAVIPGMIRCTTHGYFHDWPSEPYSAQRELSRRLTRYTHNCAWMDPTDVFDHIYVDASDPAMHTIEQAERAASLTVSAGTTEVGIYNLKDDFEYGVTMGLVIREILKYRPFACIYSTGVPLDPEQAAKGFSWLKPDNLTLKKDRLRGFLSVMP